ncbi:MAG: hypothetical protein M1113_05875 [Candidatus Thermoplasmatota archaeon]|nr:hypothetical protein [Candidatus Thermoplasmatota archaeon]
MKKLELLKVVKNLEFDTEFELYVDSTARLYINRPSKVAYRFKSYDPSKNFQIWMNEGQRTFRPNHLRLLIDLNLRIRSRPQLKNKLLIGFDRIFYGECPEKALHGIESEKFEHFLNSIMLIGHLAQAFIVEQEFNYNKVSKYSPPSLFLQGWIRQFIDSPKEIDNLAMSVAKGQPPVSKYVDLENKKSKKYQSNVKPLWYIDGSSS